MRNITDLVGSFLNKVAAFSHYKEIIALQDSINGLQHALNTAAQAKSVDKMITTMVSALVSKVNNLADMAHNYGVQASTSAKFRNDIAKMVEDLNTYISHADSNPYENNVYTLVGNALGKVSDNLTNYVPVSLDPQVREGVTTVEHPAQKNNLQEPLSTKFEFPTPQNELESWTYEEPKSVVEPASEVTKPEESKLPEEKKFNFNPKPGASGFVPGSEKTDFEAEPITSIKGAAHKVMQLARNKFAIKEAALTRNNLVNKLITKQATSSNFSETKRAIISTLIPMLEDALNKNNLQSALDLSNILTKNLTNMMNAPKDNDLETK